ncbi:MAG: MBL fold metallo-hydrolase [Verrucomicrobiales bacterium]|nr:MBL fold metallo-hydrolase [Verrucomicrobiales bacterium]
MAFRLTILGSGTSQGVPVIGKEYPSEFLANPKNHRMRPAAMVTTDEVQIAIDTPQEFRLQMLREKVNRLDALLVTHAHADHIMGMDDCRRFCQLSEKALPVYGSQTTMDILHTIFSYAFHDGPHPPTYFVPDSRVVDGPFPLADLKVTPFTLPHGSLDTTGFLFEQKGVKKVAYCTDCREMPDEVIELIEGVECVVLDALRKEPHWTHMSLDDALTAARRIRADRAVLTHLTDCYDHDIDQAELPGGVELAYDGMKIDLN